MSDFFNLPGPTGIDWAPGSGGVRTGMVRFGSDENLLVMFYNRSVENPGKSATMGRRICENQVYVKIQHPGETYNIIDRPATDEDKMRFRRHWDLFIRNRAQVPEGTPIDLLFPNYPAVAENLRAFGVYTIEQCANLSASAIDSIGRGGQEYVNKSKKYLENAEKGRGFHVQEEEIKKLKQENRLLANQFKQVKDQLDAYLMKKANPELQSLNPPFVPGFDAQAARINANHVTREIAETAKKRGRPKKISAPEIITDELAETKIDE